MSPEMLSYVPRNFIMLSSILASLLHIYRACLVSSKIKERGIVLIYRACFVVHQGLKSEIYMYYTFIPLVSYYHRLKNEVCYTFIPLVSSHQSHDGLKNETC